MDGIYELLPYSVAIYGELQSHWLMLSVSGFSVGLARFQRLGTK
jgi:hypothetical protein